MALWYWEWRPLSSSTKVLSLKCIKILRFVSIVQHNDTDSTINFKTDVISWFLMKFRYNFSEPCFGGGWICSTSSSRDEHLWVDVQELEHGGEFQFTCVGDRFLLIGFYEDELGETLDVIFVHDFSQGASNNTEGNFFLDWNTFNTSNSTLKPL